MFWLSFKEFIKDTFKYIIFIIIVLLIAIYIVGLQQVVGPSMEPNFNNNDILILDKISYKFIDIKRNDIISFNDENSKYLIKRVIGVPGDTVEIKNNILYINGNKVEESYLTGVTTSDFSLQDIGFDKIPDDYYFVLGDNRENSQDSRDKKIGLVAKKDIIGKVRLRIWPLNDFKIIK